MFYLLEMNVKNRYFRRSKISEAKFRLIVRHFALDLTATESAALSGVSVRSINSIYLRIRQRMAQWCAARSPFRGELEADESYFGPRRGRGAAGKTIVFGLLERDGCVYAEIVPNASKHTLQALSGARQTSRALSIRTLGRAMTAWWTWALTSTFASTTATTNLPEAQTMLMESNLFGALQKDGWQSSMASHAIPLPCTSKSVSFVSTIAMTTFTWLC
jgi:hypothetical protein